MGTRAGKGVLWSVLDRISTSGIQMILNILIARILLPSDYGLVAMLGIFLMISQIFVDSGFSNALIQKNHKVDADFSTVFYFNIFISCVVYVILYTVSPYIASFYNEVELEFILKLSGLVLIVNALSIVQKVKLIIALRFKLLAFISFTSVLCSGLVALWMAYHDFGVYSLIVQSLFASVLNTVLLISLVRWHPLSSFSIKSFKSLFPFGSKLLVANLLSSVYTNLYTLIIGKRFAATELGYYNRAFTLSSYFSLNITDTVMRVVYPVQCEMQDDDTQLRLNFLKLLRMLCYVIFPFMIGLASLGEPLVRVLLSEKWLPSVVLLQLLCIAYMWYPIIQLNMNLINVKGRSDYSLKAELLKKIIAIVILLITLPMGVKVMCVGLILTSCCDMMIIIYYLNKILSISLISQFKAIFPILLLSVSMGGIVFISVNRFDSDIFKLIFGGFIGAAYYLLVSYVFSMKELKALLSFWNK